jgi:hypothetical protein
MTTLPNGIGIFKGYLQFFVSLQFWPVLFAILNAVMTWYGQSQAQKYGLFTMINIDKIDELHADLSGVAGYLMLMIPFIAKGLVYWYHHLCTGHYIVYYSFGRYSFNHLAQWYTGYHIYSIRRC